MKKLPIWLYGVLLILVAVIISFSIYHFFFMPNYEQKYYEDTVKLNDQITSNAELYLTAMLDDQIDLIENFERVLHFDDFSIEQINDMNLTFVQENDYILSLELVDEDGTIYTSTNNSNRVGISISENHLFKSLDGIHNVQIGHIHYSTVTKSLTLEMLYSYEKGALLVYLSIDFFEEYGQALSESFGKHEFQIIQQDGIFVYDSENSNHEIRYRTYLFDDYKTIEETNYHSLEINGNKAIISVKKVEDYNWYLVSYIYETEAYVLRNVTQDYFLVTFLIILGIFGVTFIFVEYSLVKELRLLAIKFKEFVIGDNVPFQKMGFSKEVISVRENYNIMLNELLSKREELTFLAYHDDITSAPNTVQAKIDYTELCRKSKSIHFIYVDIKRFSIINENFGYEVGNQVLSNIYQQIKKETEYVYRVEGDEFLILLPNMKKNEVKAVISRIKNRIFLNVKLETITLNIQLNVGVSKYPGLKNFEELITSSLLAMRNNKSDFNENETFFTNTHSKLMARKSSIELNLHEALLNNEFSIVLQPILRISDTNIRGFEVLSRWSSTKFGNVSPAEFVPLLENTGLIINLDLQVLKRAVQAGKHLRETHNNDYVISVNMCVQTLMQENFTNNVLDILDTFNFPPHLLELEITESVFIHDFERIKEKMTLLRRRGIKFSEDDFGDGYSSLTYLTRLDLDTLKISKNFLESITNNIESRYLVQNIIDLSKKLGLKTIVEGIEDEDLLKIFRDYGCDYVQGYLFYKPMTVIEIDDMLKKDGENS